MNLAELRKKAQKGKEQETGHPVASVDERIYVDEDVLPAPPAPDVFAHMQLPAPVEIAEAVGISEPVDVPEPQQASRSASSEEGFPSVPFVEEPAAARVTADPQTPFTFDPLSVLLAGREAAMTDEEAFVDAGAASETGEADFQEFLCFRVSSEVYAINIMAIKEIIKPREVTEVPRAPEFVAGVLSLRGIIIPVFDMRLRLGLPVAAKSAKERIIVVKKGEEFFGIIVDEVIQVVRLATPTIEKPPAVLDGIDRDFVNGIGHFNGQMLIVLNQEKILDLTLV